MKRSNILKLIASLVIPLAIGAIAGISTSKAIPGWYETLNKPSFNPPNWIFGPVWTTLYFLMGISLFLVWRQNASRERNNAILVFITQLVLNFCWSFLFFHFHQIGLALVDIVLLWLCIFLMILLFYKIKPVAAYINIPYILWVTFATLLNAAYYFLNKG
jgi:tryptophan-rich sensory protein